MGIKPKIAILILAYFCFYVPASSSFRRGEILQLGGKPCTDHLQGSMKHTVSGTGKADPKLVGHATGGSAGGSGSQPSGVRGGGAATIPLYAAGDAGGAANDRRGNNRIHSGSNRSYNGVEFVTLAFTILASLLLRQNN